MFLKKLIIIQYKNCQMQNLSFRGTDKLIVRNCWKELPMPSAIIDHVNMLGCTKWSMLVFTDCLGCATGNYTPTVNEAGVEDGLL